MHGLMMQYQLTLPTLLRRTETFFAEVEIVSRGPDGIPHRTTYGECLTRAKRLGAQLRRMGIPPGTRVATLCWNHHQHLEAYYGVPASGFVLHTLNPRLPVDDLEYIMNDAGDRVLIADPDLLPVIETRLAKTPVERVLLTGTPVPADMHSYEAFLDDATDLEDWMDLDEGAAAAMCYTSGTSGHPKGVIYSHRSVVLHSLMTALPDVFDLGESDSILAAVPMFHANAWGLPYTAAMVGARQVLARNALDPSRLLDHLSDERVTFTAGVPTIWLGLLAELDRRRGTRTE